MSIQFLSPSFQTGSPNLFQRASQNVETYKKNRQELMSTHLDVILKDLEKTILKESLINGKGSIDYDISSVAIIPTSKVSCDKPSDAEFNILIAEVLQWLRRENLTVKQQFEKSMCTNLRTKMTISWSSKNGSSINPVDDESRPFERALPVLTMFPVKQLDDDL